MLYLYSFFHLNIAYSSIEEEQRLEVINRCYWSLLNLAEKLNLPIGIEASGFTLETINSIDSSWIAKLKELIERGVCEFIGSGYAQIIGPLVPTEVNYHNLKEGNEIYEKLLGFSPEIALVNEQAYSSALISHYKKAGYKAIIMEWNNPYHSHPEWELEWRYRVNLAVTNRVVCGKTALQSHINGNKIETDARIPVLWNDAIAFQKFQRYAHGEMELNDYLDFVKSHIPNKASSIPKYPSDAQTSNLNIGFQSRAYPLYGNDIEIFNFRPGRYHTEASLEEDEWKRILNMFVILKNTKDIKLILPSDILALSPEFGDMIPLSLESAVQPVPVKKQGKYNITRWAVSGRDDLKINTACFRIYQNLKKLEIVKKLNSLCAGNNNKYLLKREWRELCYLWSSDFRTHITKRRWERYLERLKSFELKIEKELDRHNLCTESEKIPIEKICNIKPHLDIKREGNFLTIETNTIKISLNCRRGLAIDKLWFKKISNITPLVGTLPHGYYNDISWGADYYTGHFTVESPGEIKVTDLNHVDPKIDIYDTYISVQCLIETPLGCVEKNISVYLERSLVEFKYKFDMDNIPPASLRLGHITLLPESFDSNTLFYRTSNGGETPETFWINKREELKKDINHSAPCSFLVSASHAVGITDGIVDIGDSTHYIRVHIDKSVAALIGMVVFYKIDKSWFYRLLLSAMEMDDTSIKFHKKEKIDKKREKGDDNRFKQCFSFSISSEKQR